MPLHTDDTLVSISPASGWWIRWKDGRETPVVYWALVRYPSGDSAVTGLDADDLDFRHINWARDAANDVDRYLHESQRTNG